MSVIAVSMRRDAVDGRDEVRDALEASWWPLLSQLGHVPLVVPNHTGHAADLLEALRPHAVLLTGGGLPHPTGGPGERDLVESLLISYAMTCAAPLLGVCRGMQSIAIRFGGALRPITGHVGTISRVRSRFGHHDARCFHEYSLVRAPEGFVPLATSLDGSVEAIEHITRPIRAIMWHPERALSLGRSDLELLRDSLRSQRPSTGREL